MPVLLGSRIKFTGMSGSSAASSSKNINNNINNDIKSTNHVTNNFKRGSRITTSSILSESESHVTEPYAWLADYIEGFMTGPSWVKPIQEFLNEHYMLFSEISSSSSDTVGSPDSVEEALNGCGRDSDGNSGSSSSSLSSSSSNLLNSNCNTTQDLDSENPHALYQVHQQFRTLVEDLIIAHLLEVDVSLSAFEKAAPLLDDQLVEQLASVEDFSCFKQMMQSLCRQHAKLEMRESIKTMNKDFKFGDSLNSMSSLGQNPNQNQNLGINISNIPNNQLPPYPTHPPPVPQCSRRNSQKSELSNFDTDSQSDFNTNENEEYIANYTQIPPPSVVRNLNCPDGPNIPQSISTLSQDSGAISPDLDYYKNSSNLNSNNLNNLSLTQSNNLNHNDSSAASSTSDCNATIGCGSSNGGYNESTSGLDSYLRSNRTSVENTPNEKSDYQHFDTDDASNTGASLSGVPKFRGLPKAATMTYADTSKAKEVYNNNNNNSTSDSNSNTATTVTSKVTASATASKVSQIKSAVMGNLSSQPVGGTNSSKTTTKAKLSASAIRRALLGGN